MGPTIVIVLVDVQQLDDCFYPVTGVASTDNDRTVVIDLIGELAIQKAPPGYRGV